METNHFGRVERVGGRAHRFVEVTDENDLVLVAHAVLEHAVDVVP